MREPLACLIPNGAVFSSLFLHSVLPASQVHLSPTMPSFPVHPIHPSGKSRYLQNADMSDHPGTSCSSCLDASMQ